MSPTRDTDHTPMYVGVDVGTTHTDCVFMTRSVVIARRKTPSTHDVISGVRQAIAGALLDASHTSNNGVITRIVVGIDKHLENAVADRHPSMARVSVIRLCGRATRAVPPFAEFSPDLTKLLKGSVHYINGGHHINGKELSGLDVDDLRRVAEDIYKSGVRHVAVIGVFAPDHPQHEKQVESLLGTWYPDLSVTTSHNVGDVGLIPRENATILNECLNPLAHTLVEQLCQMTSDLHINCPVLFCQGDGSVISLDKTAEYPIRTFSSRSVNSVRGAAFLSGEENAIVIDIGSSTTEVAVMVHGMPRMTSKRYNVGDVSIKQNGADVNRDSLGGGSVVRRSTKGDGSKDITVGPNVVSDKHSDSLIFGGPTLTTTDVAVARNHADIGDNEMVVHLPKRLIEATVDRIHSMIEDYVDRIKPSCADLPLILTGGGAVIVDRHRPVKGVSSVISGDNYDVATAIGAALSNVSDQPNCGESGDENRCSVDGTKVADIQLQLKEQLIALEDATPHHPRPHIDAATGEWWLSESDVESIALGAAVLGTGGGGNTHIGKLTIVNKLREGRRVRVVTPQRYYKNHDPDTHLAMVTCVAGIPTVAHEKINSGHDNSYGLAAMAGLYRSGRYDDVTGAFQDTGDCTITTRGGVTFTQNYKLADVETRHANGHGDAHETGGKSESKISALLSIEVGGINIMEPLLVGAENGLPVLDADTMGRSFPQLDMMSTNIYGVPAHPCVISTEHGVSDVIFWTESAAALEQHARSRIHELGGVIGFTTRAITGHDVLNKCIQHSISRAWKIGEAIRRARERRMKPVDAIFEVENGHVIINGKIKHMELGADGGFNKGKLTIDGMYEDTGRVVSIDVHNENLVAFDVTNGQNKLLVCVPDLISIIETETGEPVLTGDLCIGLRVSVLALACAPLTSTDIALQHVGPAGFGYKDLVYTPVAEYCAHDPVPPTE